MARRKVTRGAPPKLARARPRMPVSERVWAEETLNWQTTQDFRVDILVFTALKDELDALLEVRTGILAGWKLAEGDPPLHLAILAGRLGPIRIAAVRLTKMGGVATASLAARLLERVKPKCLAMCGVCAGHPEETDLGDVIIAERLFQHDEGKFRHDGFRGDLWVDALRDNWLRVAQDMAGPGVAFDFFAAPGGDDWKWWFLERLAAGRNPLQSTAFRRYIPDERRQEYIQSLRTERLVRLNGNAFSLTRAGKTALEEHLTLRGTLVHALPSYIYVGPMGSGNAVEAGGAIWERFAAGGMRKVLALEMEAAAIGRVSHEHMLPFAVVKGVMEHADRHKSDRFKTFAARAAAEVLCSLIRDVVAPSQVTSPPAVDSIDKIAETVQKDEDLPSNSLTRDVSASTEEALEVSALARYIHRDIWRQREAADTIVPLVLGLIFLRHLSAAFDEWRNRSANPEDRDQCRAAGVFWVSAEANWASIITKMHFSGLGKLLDDAMTAVERDNPYLRDALPKEFALFERSGRQLVQLLDLIDSGCRRLGSSLRENLPLLYRQVLDEHARSRRGFYFQTPASVAQLFVELIAPLGGRVYDPCCGSGELLLCAANFATAHSQKRTISLHGQERNWSAWRLAKIQFAMHNIFAALGPEPADIFERDLHHDLMADFILAHPPYGMRNWGAERLNEHDIRWKFGKPPARNANFAWMQQVIHHLAPTGKAGIALSPNALFATSTSERSIRKGIVEADLIDCLVALPANLLDSVSIPICLWVLAQDKKNGRSIDRRGEVLFIDAQALGRRTGRARRELAPDDIARIVDTYRAWYGDDRLGPYKDMVEFCRSVRLDEIRSNDYILVHERYLGAEMAARPDGHHELVPVVAPEVPPANESARPESPLGNLAKTPDERLWELIRELYDVEELRRFLTFLPGGDGLHRALPENGSLDTLALKTVSLLQSRGLLIVAFERMRADRPRLVDKIDVIYNLYNASGLPSLSVQPTAQQHVAKPGDRVQVSDGQASGTEFVGTRLARDDRYIARSIVEVLAKGPSSLTRALDRHISLTGGLLLTPELAGVELVAAKMLAHGRGGNAAGALLKSGYLALNELKSAIPQAEYEEARGRLRELMNAWLPFGYETSGRMKVVQSLTVRGDGCDDLEVQVVWPAIAEIFAAFADERATAYTQERRFGLSEDQQPAELRGRYNIPLPVSRSELGADARLRDVKDAIAKWLFPQGAAAPERWYPAAAARAKADREVKGTAHYRPSYLLIRENDYNSGFTRNMIRQLKEQFPALRVVSLVHGSQQEALTSDFLQVDEGVLPYLTYVFGDGDL